MRVLSTQQTFYGAVYTESLYYSRWFSVVSHSCSGWGGLMNSGYPTSRDLAKSQGQATPEKNSADRTNSVNWKNFLNITA